MPMKPKPIAPPNPVMQALRRLEAADRDAAKKRARAEARAAKKVPKRAKRAGVKP
jgi:hypothetical protein